MKTARLIYNPTAGKELVTSYLSEILTACEEAGYITSTYATKGKGDAVTAARAAAEMGFDLIVAAGGDGTLNEVINGIAPLENRPKLAILPLGTSNDFASALTIPKNDMKGALDVIKNGETKHIDIGKINDKYFVNVLGGGTLTEVSYDIPSKLKTFLGQFAYYVKGIEKLTRIESFQLAFTSEEFTYDGEVMLFLMSNSHIIGSMDLFFPDAKINDGLLDVLILKKCKITEMAKLVPALLNGNFKNNPNIVHFQTSHIEIQSLTKQIEVPINLDGELGEHTPCEITMLKKHIEIFC